MSGGLATLALAAALAIALPARAQEPAPPEDPRRLVEMPAAAQALLRKDMLDHMSALNAVLAKLVAGDLEGAAELAESRLGRGSMGRHRGTGMGPGRFMPREMHQVGMAMHRFADDLAAAARAGDADGSYAALQHITGTCVACHAGFRIR